jgi:hypothetical protein
MKRTAKMTVQKFDEFNEMLSKDLLSLSDDELLSETREDVGDLAQFIAETKQVYQSAVTLSGKRRLQASKEAIEKEIPRTFVSERKIDIVKARRLLTQIAANDVNIRERVTLAARNLEDLTDDDIRTILADLEELGAISNEDLS